MGKTQNVSDLLKLNFDYGELQTNGTVDALKNNGNIAKQTITVPSVSSPSVSAGFVATQTYSYDSLNRIKSAVENITPTGGTTSQSWKQTFVYDRFGNRRFDAANTTTLATNCVIAVCNPTVDPATNKLIGYQFDAGGNTTRDAENRKFTYDGENKQVKVETVDASGNPIAIVGQYSYDGDGRRIKKIVPATGETTIFVYDAGGKLVAEYSTIIAAPADAKVSYLTNDHLGSPRVITDQNGKVTSRRDFMPFGEEIFPTQRMSSLNYTTDNVRQKFTGYERDNETSLDYAKARMFGSAVGRFTSPDPLMSSAKRIVPQSWNRYTYVLNNPLNLVDPSGMIWGYQDFTKDGQTFRRFCFAPGDALCKGFKAYNGPRIIENTNYGTVKLNSNGTFTTIGPSPLPKGLGGSMRERDAETAINAAGGMLCSVTMTVVCIGDPNSKTTQNAQAAADLVQMAFLIKSLLKLGLSLATVAMIVKKDPEAIASLVEKVSHGVIKEIPKDFFEGTRYSNKVLGQMKKVKAGEYHGFPESVKAFQGDGVITIIKGGDGATREMLKIPGTYGGKNGVFEFIKEADGTINHRLFVPDP